MSPADEASEPAQVRDKVSVQHQVRGRTMTIVERRPPLVADRGAGVDDHADRPAALRPAPPVGGRWQLYWADRNRRWHLMDDVASAVTPAPLLAELDADPTGIFWG
jgi:Protein of unknown function (DUF3024)